MFNSLSTSRSVPSLVTVSRRLHVSSAVDSVLRYVDRKESKP